MNDKPQRTSEWFEQLDMGYFDRQLKHPYESTKEFFAFVTAHLELAGQSLIDAGCGNGANLIYADGTYGLGDSLGFDLNPAHIESGTRYIQAHGINQVRLATGDLYEPPASWWGRYDGLISLQTLSWLPNYDDALRSLSKLPKQWMAFSSLFYEGRIDAKIEITEFEEDFTSRRDVYYNVYSLERFAHVCRAHGFPHFEFQRFDIRIDLTHADPHRLGSYTIPDHSGRNLQFTGPIVLPWYFVFAAR